MNCRATGTGVSKEEERERAKPQVEGETGREEGAMPCPPLLQCPCPSLTSEFPLLLENSDTSFPTKASGVSVTDIHFLLPLYSPSLSILGYTDSESGQLLVCLSHPVNLNSLGSGTMRSYFLCHSSSYCDWHTEILVWSRLSQGCSSK